MVIHSKLDEYTVYFLTIFNLQINLMLKSKEKILTEQNFNVNCAMKRKQQKKFGHVNVLLLEWFKSAR